MSRRPPDVICGAAIFDSRWRRWKWRHPEPGAGFSIPSEVEVENGGPSASGRHLGWPHFRFPKWGHSRWRPEAEGQPFSTSTSLGVEKPAPGSGWRHFQRRHLESKMAAPQMTSGGRRDILQMSVPSSERAHPSPKISCRHPHCSYSHVKWGCLPWHSYI